MKCSHCGKKINEMTERYSLLTLDGDFIHDNCIKAYNQYKSKVLETNLEEEYNYDKSFRK